MLHERAQQHTVTPFPSLDSLALAVSEEKQTPAVCLKRIL